MSHFNRRTFVRLAAVPVVMFLSCASASAHGAFAIGGDTHDSEFGFAAGYAWDQPTEAQAEAHAMDKCKAYPSNAPDHTNKLCKIVANFQHQWLVIALDPDRGMTGFGWALDADLALAQSKALAACQASAPADRKSHCVVGAAQEDKQP